MALSLSCSLYQLSQKRTTGIHLNHNPDRSFRNRVQVGHQSGVLCRRIQVRCSTADRATLSAGAYEKPSMASNYETVTELPPLYPSLLNVEGLPPLVRVSSDWEAEAQRQLLEIAERWKTDSLKLWIAPSILFCSFVYGKAVSLDRFMGLSLIVLLTFALDDLFFDRPHDSLLEEFGIDSAARESPATIMEYHRHLWGFFDRDGPLKENPAAIEGLMWECGKLIRRLSNPERFAEISDALLDEFEATVACEMDPIQQCQDLGAYIAMRSCNSGANWCVLLLQYSMNAYLPSAIRTHPVLVQLMDRAIVHMSFVNDVMSYAKEVVEEPDNPRNLLKVMVDWEGMALPQAAWRAVDIINAYARAVMELETQLLACDEATPGVRAWAYELKLMMTGNILFYAASKRYFVRGSVFPEFELQ